MTCPTNTSASTPITGPEVQVAVGLVQDTPGRVLVSRRRVGAHLGGLWEFPGGKCGPGENARAALDREFREELGIRVLVATEILSIPHQYPGRSVLLRAFRVDRWSGQIRPREDQPLRWVETQQLARLEFPAASRPIVTAACLPPLYLISPDPGSPARIEACVRQVERSLVRRGIRLLQVRAPTLERSSFLAYARALIGSASRLGVAVLVNAPPEWLDVLPAAGWHLTERRLKALPSRPDRSGWIAASVHDRQSLERAMGLPVDFVVAGPVRATRTHPGAQPIGIRAFARLRDAASCPVFALGGMTPADLHAIQAAGGQGIAAIRGLLD